MGGVLTATLWQNGQLEIEKVIFDGSPLVVCQWHYEKNDATVLFEYNSQVTTKRQKKHWRKRQKYLPQEYLRDFLQVLDNMSDTTI